MSNPQSAPNPATQSEAISAASITIGNIQLDPGAKWIDGLFPDCVINGRLENPQHILMMPIASPNGFNGQKAVFAQVAAPTLVWVVDWTICSMFSAFAPDPTPADPNWVMLLPIVEPAVITAMADGSTPMYRLSGTYRYGHKKPNADVFKHINFARPPWLEDTFNRIYSVVTKLRSLMDVANGGSGGTAPSPGSGGKKG